MQRGRASAGGNPTGRRPSEVARIQVNRGGGQGGFDRGRHGGGRGGFREDRGRREHEVSTPSVPPTATTSQEARSGAAYRRGSDRDFVRESILGVPANYRPPCFLIPRKDPFAGEWDPEWVVLRGFDNDELSASASASQIECAVAEADAADASALRGRGQVPVSDTSTEMDVTGADLLCSGSSGNSANGSQHKQQEPIKSAGGLVDSSAKPQRVSKERAPKNESALLQASVPPALEQKIGRAHD